jgi:hypothetical protein
MDPKKSHRAEKGQRSTAKGDVVKVHPKSSKGAEEVTLLVLKTSAGKTHHALQTTGLLNGALSAYDLTGRTTDRLISVFEPKRVVRGKSGFQAVDLAFGASAAHLSNAIRIVDMNVKGKIYDAPKSADAGTFTRIEKARIRE